MIDSSTDGQASEQGPGASVRAWSGRGPRERCGVVELVRGGTVESRQAIHAAVVGADGSLVASVGDPNRLTTLRSTAKPWQARVFVQSSTSYDNAVLAVICGSHQGLPMHVDAVQSGFNTAGLLPNFLENNPSVFTDERLRQQCSGIHMAFLVASSINGWPLAGYGALTHPSQTAAHKELAASADLRADGVPIMIDDCGIATFALPLQVIARLYARLPVSDPAQFNAMRAFPDLVAGPDRLDSCLMRALPGAVAKCGSEGLQAIALSDRGLGVAIRVEDGDPQQRALGAATIAVLRQLLDTDLGSLENFAEPKLTVLGRETVIVAAMRSNIELKFV